MREVLCSPLSLRTNVKNCRNKVEIYWEGADLLETDRQGSTNLLLLQAGLIMEHRSFPAFLSGPRKRQWGHDVLYPSAFNFLSSPHDLPT